MNVVQSLGEYVNKVLDTNGDGRLTFSDFLGLFPNNAIGIAVLFVDLMVAVAEYRVWDVGIQMTDDPLKAIGFVLVSAVPFYLGQIFWLYPVANFPQKAIAVGMVGASLYTSWEFGTADLSLNWQVDVIVSMVVNLTAAYIVGVLGYILMDDSIKAHRLKKQAEGAAKLEKEYQEITRSVLRELATTQKIQNETIAEFGGDSDLVQSQLDRVRGRKNKPVAPAYTPTTTYASDAERMKLEEKPRPNSQGRTD